MEPQLPLLSIVEFLSDSLDEVRERVGRSYCPHKLQITKRDERLQACHHRAPLVNTSINFLHYVAEVAIDPGQMRSFYLVEAPLNGAARVRLRGREVVSGLERALVLSPRFHLSPSGPPGDILWSRSIALPSAEIVTDLIDRPLTVPLEFEPGMESIVWSRIGISAAAQSHLERDRGG